MARVALRQVPSYRSFLDGRRDGVQAISAYFGLHPAHCFHAKPVAWLQPTEAQVTRALAQFLQAGGASRILAFLRAIDPMIDWPAELSSAHAAAEVPTRKGRIDLLVTGTANGRFWGAAVEAKFGHHLKHNPLHDYARHIEELGRSMTAQAEEPMMLTFVVVGQNAKSKITRTRLGRNRRWQYLSWQALLRRFERKIENQPDDSAFRQFRRTIWERAG